MKMSAGEEVVSLFMAHRGSQRVAQGRWDSVLTGTTRSGTGATSTVVDDSGSESFVVEFTLALRFSRIQL